MRSAGSSAAVSAVGAFDAARASSDQKSLAPRAPGSLDRDDVLHRVDGAHRVGRALERGGRGDQDAGAAVGQPVADRVRARTA